MTDVLDYGYVKLISAWGSEEQIIEAARMSTGKGFQGWAMWRCDICGVELDQCQPHTSAPGLMCPNETRFTWTPRDEKLLTYLYKHKHATPFEMAGLTIEIKAPLFVFREWHRHRTQSYNEMSARYVPLPDENYLPSLVRIIDGAAQAASNRQAAGTARLASRSELAAWLVKLELLYQRAQSVYDEGLDLGVPKELARLPVPVARYSKMRASANLRNWLAFLALRLARTAQWEIRQYAEAVGREVAEKFPRTWALFQEEQIKNL